MYNLVGSFNNWIENHKAMNLDDLMDKMRQLLTGKWDKEDNSKKN